jgi:hypothetical protein
MRARLAALALAVLAGRASAWAQAADPAAPTCPPNPGWSTNREMTFTVMERPGQASVLLAEGVIDDALIPRLQTALDSFQGSEIWLRSPGGDARTGNQAGRLIRQHGLSTRIPAGWACAGSCAFVFLGGISRSVEPGGLYIVQMFTFTGNREAIRRELARGGEATPDLLTDIARQSAQLVTEDTDYLLRMGVSRALLADIVYRQRAVSSAAGGPTRRCLTDAELRRYFVVNDAQPIR